MQKRKIADSIVVCLVFLAAGSISIQSAQAAINVRDFGAKGDNKTDDTEAIRAAFKAAERKYGHDHVRSDGSRSMWTPTRPEIVFPAGQYLISDTIHLTGGVIRGEGQALILQTNDHKDIFTSQTAWRLTISGLTFFGGRNQLQLSNPNWDKGFVLIDQCRFYYAAGVAIIMDKGSASTQLKIRNCVFVEPEQALISHCDYTVIRDTWITSSSKMENKAVIENCHGTMTLDHIVGVPLTSGVDQRWVDNYDSLKCKSVRFGGEGGGFTAVINFAKRRPEVDGPFIVLEDCTVSAQGNLKRKCAVYLEEIPNAIWIKRSILLGVEALRISPNIDLKAYFAGVRPGMLRFSIEDNVGEFMGELPELLKNPILEGVSETDLLPVLSDNEAKKAIKSAIAKQAKIQKQQKEILSAKYRTHKQQTAPAQYMEIAFDEGKWSLDNYVDALSDKNSKYLAVAPAGDDVIVLRKRTDKWPHVLIKDVTIDLDKFPYLTWKLTDTGRGQQRYAVRAIEQRSQAMVTWEEDLAPPWDGYHAYDLRDKFNLEGGKHSFDIKFYYLPWSMTDSITSVNSNLGDYLVIDFIRAEAE